MEGSWAIRVAQQITPTRQCPVVKVKLCGHPRPLLAKFMASNHEVDNLYLLITHQVTS